MLQQSIALDDDSRVGEARRAAAAFSRLTRLSEAEAGRVAIIVNELGSNVRKHAGGGEILIRELGTGEHTGVEILATDRGPGMDVARALKDGHSTSGTRGEGLGAVARLADEFDAWGGQGGSVVVARVWHGGRAPDHGVAIGAVSQPLPGEAQNGDGWDVRFLPGRVRVVVVDGLGHGPIAARAASTTLEAFAGSDRFPGPEAILHALHAALRSTRGAAIAVAEIDLIARTVRFSGVGNISASVQAAGHPPRGLLSHNGIAGHEARRIQEFTASWHPHALLIVQSDGLHGNWKLEAYSGLQARHPSVIAGVLYRDFRRKADDSTVLVVKEP